MFVGSLWPRRPELKNILKTPAVLESFCAPSTVLPNSSQMVNTAAKVAEPQPPTSRSVAVTATAGPRDVQCSRRIARGYDRSGLG